MSAPPFPLWAWLVFVGLVLALLFLDLFVIHRNERGAVQGGDVAFAILPRLRGFVCIWLAWVGPQRTSPPTC